MNLLIKITSVVIWCAPITISPLLIEQMTGIKPFTAVAIYFGLLCAGELGLIIEKAIFNVNSK